MHQLRTLNDEHSFRSQQSFIVCGSTAAFTHFGTRETFTLAEMIARGYTAEELATVPLGTLRSEGRRRSAKPSA
jgi:hypothetical protein